VEILVGGRPFYFQKQEIMNEIRGPAVRDTGPFSLLDCGEEPINGFLEEIERKTGENQRTIGVRVSPVLRLD